MKRRRPTPLALLALALLISACDDNDPGGVDPDAGHTPGQAALACDHFEYGPIVAIEADPSGAPPAFTQPMHRYDIDPATTPRVLYTPEAAGKYLLLIDRDATLELSMDATGAPHAPEMVMRPVADCAAAAAAYHFELATVGYRIDVGGGEPVQLVIHGPIGEGGHHEHGG